MKEFFIGQSYKINMQALNNGAIINLTGQSISIIISNPDYSYTIVKKNTLAGGNDSQVYVNDASKGLFTIYVNSAESGNLSNGIWTVTATISGTNTYIVKSNFYAKADSVESNYNIQIQANITAAGDGLTVDLSGETYSVNVDDSTIEINGSNQVAIKENGITVRELSDSSVKTEIINDLAVTNDKIATGIDTTKLADGSISNTEFQYLNGVSSNIQTQLTDKDNRLTAIEDELPSGGISGDIVGTDNTQTLDNKTLLWSSGDSTLLQSDTYFINIAKTAHKTYQIEQENTTVETQRITTNKNSQTLTNKTIDGLSNSITNVNGSNIINDTITQSKMADDSVGTAEIINANVTLPKIVLLDNAKVITSDGSNNKQVALSGDVTMDNNGVVTIGNEKITSAKLASEIVLKKLTITPSANGDGIFNITLANGTVILKVNTSTNRIIAQNGMKFEGDGSLLTNILSVGTGGTSSTTDLQLIANSDSSGGGDIKLMVGSTVVGRIKGDATATKGIFEIVETAVATAFLTPTSGSVGIGAKENQLFRVDDAGKTGQLICADDWGEPKGGLLFDGVNDYINILDSANLDFGDALGNDKPFSLEFFGYIEAGTTGRGIITKGTDTLREYGLFISTTNRINIALYSGGLSNRLSVYYPTVLTSGWYHIVGTYDGSKANSGLKLYLNGTLLTVTNDNTGTYAGNNVNTGTVSIGRWFSNGSGYLSGKAIVARIWNRVLTQSEIIKLYSNGLLGVNALPISDVGANNTDLFSPLDFNVGYTTVDATIIDADSFSTAGIGGLLKFTNLKVGARYKLTAVGDTTTSEITFRSSSPNVVYQTGFGTTEFICVNPTLYIRHASAGTSNFTTLQLTQIGCVAEYLPENAGRIGWIETMNGLHGNTSGSPLCLNAEQRPLVYRDVKLAVANTATALTNIVPKGYRISTIRAVGTASLSSVIIGTSSGGSQIVTSTTVSTTASLLTLAGNVYSETADTTLYAQHGTSGQTMDLIFVFEKINN